MAEGKKLGGDATSDRSTTSDHSKTGNLADEAREEAEELGRQAGDQVTSQLNEQKDRASDQLNTVSSALRNTSDELRSDDEAMLAKYMDGAAHQVDKLSEYLYHNSVSDIYNEVEHYARREPSLFIGGAMLAGFLGARFLKSSSPDRRDSRYSRSDRMRPPETHRRRTYRDSPPSDRSHSQVHGTPGGEMPDSGEQSSASRRADDRESTASTRSPGDVPSARRQTPNMPQQATSRTSQQAAPSMPDTSADDSDKKEVT